jgi:hypothetical protein
MPPRSAPLTDEHEIPELIRQHGRWWHEIEVAPGIITPGDDSNRMKLPILDALGLPADLSGLRALEAALEEAQFRVDALQIVSMGGYASATAIDDPLTAKYQRLDSRLESSPFDPSVPYFLDEPRAVQTVTPRRDKSDSTG